MLGNVSAISFVDVLDWEVSNVCCAGNDCVLSAASMLLILDMLSRNVYCAEQFIQAIQLLFPFISCLVML